eukprot:176410_1
MSQLLQSIKDANQQTIDLVHGFIRESQLLLSNESTFYNIPPLIIHLCLCYFYIRDRWSEILKGNDYTIEDDMLIKIKGSYQSAFMENTMSSGVYHWKFHLIKYGEGSGLQIGIFKEKYNPETVLKDSIGDKKDTAYIFRPTDPSIKYKSDNENKHIIKAYGTIKCDEGDIYEMIADFDKLELKWCVNGVDLGKAFDIEKCEYRAGVYMYSKGLKLKFISCR